MKVYGGILFVQGKQARGIVAGSQKRVAELTGMSLHHIRDYWAETRNKLELETALAEPGVLFWTPLYGKCDYKPVATQPAPHVDEREREMKQHVEEMLSEVSEWPPSR